MSALGRFRPVSPPSRHYRVSLFEQPKAKRAYEPWEAPTGRALSRF